MTGILWTYPLCILSAMFRCCSTLSDSTPFSDPSNVLPITSVDFSMLFPSCPTLCILYVLILLLLIQVPGCCLRLRCTAVFEFRSLGVVKHFRYNLRKT